MNISLCPFVQAALTKANTELKDQVSKLQASCDDLTAQLQAAQQKVGTDCVMLTSLSGWQLSGNACEWLHGAFVLPRYFITVLVYFGITLLYSYGIRLFFLFLFFFLLTCLDLLLLFQAVYLCGTSLLSHTRIARLIGSVTLLLSKRNIQW